MTALSCPSNLSWKVWLAGGRMELSAGNVGKARSLFLRAHKVCAGEGTLSQSTLGQGRKEIIKIILHWFLWCVICGIG